MTTPPGSPAALSQPRLPHLAAKGSRRVPGCLALFIALPAVIGLIQAITGPERLTGVGFMLGGGFLYVMGKGILVAFTHDLADEVLDGGTFLVYRRDGKSVTINLSDIERVAYSGFQKPARVVLTLKNKSVLGKHLAFEPIEGGTLASSTAADLLHRVQQSRSGPAEAPTREV